ncbi:hypothetical protein GALMADRAFT_264952 [Galerina marginata CBS 339.88]|uniref:BTB domain-containing protein n=1 Tax=Galerina marginata (strain CBS 339.88) TaxID=685588 RepID=A0A067TFB1_GALM3|nr:hypothetical protein GALMADRAFT_264952 [Galerina marginata CBS 339.88]
MEPKTDNEGEEKPEDPPAVVRHSKFYKNHGDVILQVEKTLYRLDSRVLSDLSEFFSELFSLPQGVHVEGKTDENPIIVQMVTVEEFDHLILACIHVEWSIPPHPVKRHLDVLKLATMWRFPDYVKDQAVFELMRYKSKEFPPVEKLYLARCYDIKEFLEPAFKELCTPGATLAELSSNDIFRIGLSIYEVLTKVKEAIARDRRWFAFHAPKLSHIPRTDDCTKDQHKKCKKAWNSEWWKVMGRRILQPVDVFALNFQCSEAEDVLKSLEVPGMNPSCLGALLDFVEQSDALQFEKVHIQNGVNELIRRLEAGQLNY